MEDRPIRNLPNCPVTKKPCENRQPTKEQGSCLFKREDNSAPFVTTCSRIYNPKAWEKEDLVNHPAHYGGKDNPYEVIKVIRAWLNQEQFYGWLLGTIIKYLGRTGKKDSVQQDWAKLQWYSEYLAQWLKETGYAPNQKP